MERGGSSEVKLRDATGAVLGTREPARGFSSLYRRSGVRRLLRRHVNLAAWETRQQTMFRNHFLGVPVLKLPTDLWMYQEVISEVRPDLIVETGTYRGGTALYLAWLCDAVGRGRVMSIDIERYGELPRHPRLEFLHGSSVSDEIRTQVERAAACDQRVLVILDSDHSREHVLAELRTYGNLVSVGSYVIVEDTNLNGHPVEPDWGPGPMEAVEAFLAADRRFEPDLERERHFLTLNPRGYLRRTR